MQKYLQKSLFPLQTLLKTPLRFQSTSAIFPKLEKMSESVIVKHFEGETRFTFSFHLVLPQFKIDKQFNLNRELEEETKAFLDRLTNNVNKANKVKGTNVSVKFIDENQSVIDHSDTFKTVQDFLFMKNLKLNIENLVFPVKINPPLVRELKISEVAMTDLLIYPYSLELDFADSSQTKIEWFVSQRLSEDLLKQKKLTEEFLNHHQKRAKIELSWSRLGEGFFVTPRTENINCLLKCSVTPRDQSGGEGETSSLVISQPITAGPGPTPAQNR